MAPIETNLVGGAIVGYTNLFKNCRAIWLIDSCFAGSLIDPFVPKTEAERKQIEDRQFVAPMTISQAVAAGRLPRSKEFLVFTATDDRTAATVYVNGLQFLIDYPGDGSAFANELIAQDFFSSWQDTPHLLTLFTNLRQQSGSDLHKKKGQVYFRTADPGYSCTVREMDLQAADTALHNTPQTAQDGT